MNMEYEEVSTNKAMKALLNTYLDVYTTSANGSGPFFSFSTYI